MYSDTIDSVVIPTVEGEDGMSSPGHIPLLTQVAHGELRVKPKATATQIARGQAAGAPRSTATLCACSPSTPSPKRRSMSTSSRRALNVRRGADSRGAAKDMDPQQLEHLQSLVRYSGVQLAVKRRSR